MTIIDDIIIGNVLHRPQLITPLSLENGITAGDFVKREAQIIWQNLYDADEVTELDSMIVAAGTTYDDAVVKYAANCFDEYPLPMDITPQVNALQRRSLARRATLFANECIGLCRDENVESEAIMDFVVEGANNLVGLKAEDVDPHDDMIEKLHAAMNGEVDCVGTRIGEIDNIVGGFFRGNVFVIGARTSQGKTALAAQMAAACGLQNEGAVFYTMEMSKTEVFQRVACNVAGINSYKVRSGTVDEFEYKAITTAADEVRDMPLVFDETNGYTVGSISRSLQYHRKTLRAKGSDLRCVFLDYIGLMSVPGKSENRTREIGKISREIKQLAKKLNVTFVVLAQLNREADKRDTPPRVSDLRDSGDIEQDADIIALIHVVEERKYGNRSVDVIIGKHRNGPLGRATLLFEGQTGRFSDDLVRREAIEREKAEEKTRQEDR